MFTPLERTINIHYNFSLIGYDRHVPVALGTPESASVLGGHLQPLPAHGRRWVNLPATTYYLSLIHI